MKVAKLALEDGTVFTGTSFGAEGEVDGEVCFNTSMTGYQEILTDPSYRGQIVTMTYPQSATTASTPRTSKAAGRTWPGSSSANTAAWPSNFRADGDLDDYLKRHGVVGIEGIDTRALVRRLRIRGAHEGRAFDASISTTPAWWPRPRPARAWSAAIWCAK